MKETVVMSKYSRFEEEMVVLINIAKINIPVVTFNQYGTTKTTIELLLF